MRLELPTTAFFVQFNDYKKGEASFKILSHMGEIV